MSASPSGSSNGPTPNGGPPRFIRRPKPTDPLRPRKKPIPRPPPGGALPKPNGAPVKRPPHQYPVSGVTPARGQGSYPLPPSSQGGWTHPPTGSFTDYPLVTTKRALREGLRYHVAKFQSKKDIDPRDQDEFTRPVILHRRDPKQPPPGKGVKDEDLAAEPVDSKERERQEILKAEKEKQRAADLAQIAPTGSSASAIAAKKSQAFRNEKTTQVHRLDKTEEQKKASDLKYEEALPWHLEDADNKNTWVGNYEAALSDTNVVFVIDGGHFKMIPVEKWYRFTAKGQFKTFTIEEVEAKMNKKVKESRWVMKDSERSEMERATQDTRKTLNSLYKVKAESNTFKNSAKREVADMDDLDFEEDDLFQDDDEQVTVEPEQDEGVKETQERLKREQLAANIFDQANEAEVDKELNEEEEEEEKRKKLGKSVKKAIRKREKNYIYDSDSDHPYSESSDDDTSDEEKQKEIDRKKDEEAKNKAKAESKLPSGASSKGTNTPSGRPKHSDPLKTKNLKRPGSPNLSESSGNESSRKKHKKKHHQHGTSTPLSGSRQISANPSGSQPMSGVTSTSPNNGAMSDGEATGGEGSDGGRKTILKIRTNKGSPNGSRAGSPIPRASSIGAGGSRAGSPAASPPSQKSPSAGPIKPHEIVAFLPATGITIADLMKMFTGRVGDNPQTQTERKEFIRMVKENSKYGPDKLLRPK